MRARSFWGLGQCSWSHRQKVRIWPQLLRWLSLLSFLPGHAIADAGAQPPPPAAGIDVDGLLRNAFQFVLTTIDAAPHYQLLTNYNSKDRASINKRLDKGLASINNRLEKLEDNVVTKTDVLMTIVTVCATAAFSMSVLPQFVRS